jgi:hypothetical protein
MYLAPFYANTAKLNPEGQPLGKVLAFEPTVSTVPGSKAWRIAYVSSDGADRRTVVTAVIAVPMSPPAPPAAAAPANCPNRPSPSTRSCCPAAPAGVTLACRPWKL